MDPSSYDALARAGHNRIPCTRAVLADLDTPLSAYLKLAAGPGSYLLESVQGGEKWGRYSIIGLPAAEHVVVRGHEVRHERDGALLEHAEAADPLAWIEAFRRRFRVPALDGLPRFSGGLVGYFGYDTVRYIEPRLGRSIKPDPIGVPDILLLVSDEVLVFDNLSGRLHLVVHARPQERTDAWHAAQQRLDALIEALRRPAPPAAVLAADAPDDPQVPFGGSFSRAAYEAAVERIKAYIMAGDVMQVVPSQRMTAPYTGSALDLYRALRCLNPSPYLFYLDLGGFQVVGSSPEVLARLDGGELTVRPIAGTRRRGATEAEDRALEAELLADTKERAEHLMLIDLGRNDVGRVAEVGSVEVTEHMVIERYAHVMHIVSNVRGRLRPGLTPVDALRAAFPAGTLTGAPKVRAMEIIEELEPVKRGVYGGAVGYLAWNGNMDLAIAIRTAVLKDGQVHVQAGGGIVADSQPAPEWEETLAKRRALFRAVAMAQGETGP